MRYLKSYIELTLKYGTLSRHPMFSHLHPELRHAVFRRVSMSRQYKFCYFRVPKAANSTVIETLQVKMKGEPSGSARPFPKHALHGVPAEFEMPGLFVFTVVRNPVTRLLSTFLDKVPQEKYRMKYNLHHGDPQRTFSLEDFLRRLDDGMLYKDIHWAPQTSILPYSLDKYDFVGKFENIEEDLSHIMKEIFNESYEIRTVNHHRTASMEMLKNLSIREISLIERLYEKDFINFDYDT